MNNLPNRWDILEKLIKKYNCKNIAEIGICVGQTAEKLIERCNLDRYYLIDIEKHINFPLTNPIWKKPEVKFIWKASIEAVNEIEDDSLDLVFIDANHWYENVKLDTESWFPKVKIGGLITGHDYHPYFQPDVVKYVEELKVKGIEIFMEPEIDNETKIWWFFKKENLKIKDDNNE